MKKGGCLRGFGCCVLSVCLFLATFSLCVSVAHADVKKKLDIDKETFKKQISDAVVEKLFGNLHKIPEDKLKDATYFNELVKDMAPLGIKLDETNFSDTALNIYNKYKEAIDSKKSPEEAKEEVKKLLKGDVQSLVFQSLDKGSQDVLNDLQGLYNDAKKDLEAITGLNKELAENPDADYAKLLKKYGVKGEMLEKFEKMEGKLRGVVNSDYIKAGKIIYDGMSGSSGDKIEALFALGSEFGGKVPVIGKFVELYFKVAQEMLKQTGKLASLFEAQQAGCLGDYTKGQIETVKIAQNERNLAFKNAGLSGFVCPVDRTKAFYQDIYVDQDNGKKIYFWTGSGFVKGKTENGGVDSVKALRTFLRSVGKADKANDMKFMIDAYNMSPGFLERKKEYEKMIEDINKLIGKLDDALCYRSGEFNNFLKEKGGLQRVVDTSDGYVDDDPERKIYLWGAESLVEKILEDYYIKNRAKFGGACKNALPMLRDIVVAKVKGQVFIKKDGDTEYAPSGIAIIADPEDKVVTECSSSSTDSNGLFEILVLKDQGESFSLSLKAKDGEEEESDEVSVSISGSTNRYNVRLTIEGSCKEGQELKNGKCVPICKEDEELNKDGTKCLSACKANEERDDNDKCVCEDGYEAIDGKCVEKCEPNEKRNDKGECEAVCPEGQKMGDSGKCESICKPNEKYIEGACKAVCEEGYKVEKDGKCTKLCGENAELDEKGECVCKKGFEEVDGECVKGCGLNATRNEDGDCVCKDGYEDVKGVCAPACKPNEKRNDDGKCIDVCGPNARYLADEDACECKEGFDVFNDECVPKCNAGEERNAKGECVPPCKPNEKRDNDGNCIDVCGPNARYVAAEDVCECNDGFEVVNDTCMRECKKGEIRDAGGKCVSSCKANEKLDANGECVQVCGPNARYIAAEDVCECKAGYDVFNDECVPACGENEIRRSDGNCDCKSGYIRGKDGNCELDIDRCTSNSDCSTGYECDAASGKCVYVGMPGCETTGCPAGYECNRESGECVYKEPSGCRSNSDCPVGYACSGGECVSPFDSNYDGFTSQLGSKDDQRDQQNIDQTTMDQQTGGSRPGGFTSAELDDELEEIAQNLGCRSDADCRDGFKCKNGRCEEVKTEPTRPPAETSPPEPPEEEEEAPVEAATSTGIGIEEVGTAPEGQTLIVDGQLVPVEGWPVNIAGMSLVLTGPVNKSTSSSGSGKFNFTLIPAGEYVISVTEWDYGMTSQAFTAPSGKAIKITLKGSCPYLYVWDGKGYAKENDIYSVARVYPSELMTDKNQLYADRDGLFLQPVSLENMSRAFISRKSYRDYYQINSRFAVDPDGYYRAKVREQAYERSLTDQIELWAVDHPVGTRTGITRNGRLFQYEEILPLTGSAQTGEAALFDKEVLAVTLPLAAFGKGFLAVDWQGFQNGDGRGKTSSAGKPKLFLQRLNPDGVWQNVDYVYPRDEIQRSFFILDDLGAGWDKGNTVRLVATSCHTEKYHRIDGVGWAEFLPETPTARHLPLVSAVTTKGDDVRLKALEADGDSIFLGPDEEVFLKFKPYPASEGMERSFIFVSQGVYVPMPRVLLGEAK